MRKAVMLLTGPGAGFEVVDAADVFSPGCLASLLISRSAQILWRQLSEDYTILLNLLY